MTDRFKLWRTLDELGRHTEEWAVIDTTIECNDIKEREEYEGVLISYENIFEEEEVIDLLNDMDNEIKCLRREVAEQKLEKWRITNFFKNLPDDNYTDYFFDCLMKGRVPE